MKRPAWNRAAQLLAAIAIGGAAAACAPGQVRDAEVACRDQQEVARMTQKMTIVCMGRFLVHLPEEARLALARPRIHGLGISSFDEPEADFRARLVQREARLRAAPDRLVPNPENRVPAEPGFCVRRAWFHDPLTADQGEQTMMVARLPSQKSWHPVSPASASARVSRAPGA